MITLWLHLEIYHCMKSKLKGNLYNRKNTSQNMRTEIKKVLCLNKFFKIVQTTQQNISYVLENPSKILMQNIHTNWLKFVWSKTSKYMPVFLDKSYVQEKMGDINCFAFLKCNISEHEVVVHDISEYNPKVLSTLELNVIIPQQDAMQYFIQWQRYRKFWWSSITTTPSLFSVNDIKYSDSNANVEIIAQFPWGAQSVETITVQPNDNISKDMSCLTCTTSLESALYTLLLDGMTIQNEEGYLRLHRVMAPYKISFALIYKEQKHEQMLRDLAILLHRRLKIKKISTWIPNWTLSLNSQIKENLQMGVTYTAILDENTLENGVINLMNSSTMLKEQVHIADFDSYAALLCGK